MASPSIESGAMQGREHVVRAGWKARARTAEDDDEGRSWGSSWEKEGGGGGPLVAVWKTGTVPKNGNSGSSCGTELDGCAGRGCAKLAAKVQGGKHPFQN